MAQESAKYTRRYMPGETCVEGVRDIQPSWHEGAPQQTRPSLSLQPANTGTPGPLWGHAVCGKGFLPKKWANQSEDLQRDKNFKPHELKKEVLRGKIFH